MCSMINAYVHSYTDYCIDIWSVQNEIRLNLIQNKIDRFLINYFFPTILKKVVVRNCIVLLGIILILMNYVTCATS
jgi:hypothetical protein